MPITCVETVEYLDRDGEVFATGTVYWGWLETKNAVVAQLEERLPSKQDVAGSMPVGRTKEPELERQSRRPLTAQVGVRVPAAPPAQNSEIRWPIG